MCWEANRKKSYFEFFKTVLPRGRGASGPWTSTNFVVVDVGAGGKKRFDVFAYWLFRLVLFIVCSFCFCFFCVCVLFGRPSNRREAVPVSLARVSVAFRAQRRADAPLSQTHRRQAVPVQSVRALLRPLRSPGAAHETAPAQRFQMNGLPCSAPRTLDCHRSLSVFFFCRVGTASDREEFTRQHELPVQQTILT